MISNSFLFYYIVSIFMTVEDVNSIVTGDKINIYNSKNLSKIDCKGYSIGYFELDKYRKFIYIDTDTILYLVENLNSEDSNLLLDRLGNSINVRAYLKNGNILWSIDERYNNVDGVRFVNYNSTMATDPIKDSIYYYRKKSVKYLSIFELGLISQKALQYNSGVYKPITSFPHKEKIDYIFNNVLKQ